ncbi:MAG: GGDEF domain-containing protein [Vicinamibacterales bacterium]
MEIFLYQLSIWGLVISSLMIATFFAVLRRSMRRVEMRWWTYGWIGNVGAMLVTLGFWYFQPPATLHGLVFALYMVGKSVYVWMLVRGALEFRSWRPPALEAKSVVPFIVVFSLISIFVVDTRDRLGLAAMAIVAIGFTAGALALARARVPAARWIVIAFAVRALLAIAEAAAYGVNVVGITPGEQVADAFLVPANWILASHYPLDTAAEWLLAMGCVIGISARAQHELQLANTQMLSAQADLRRLVDRDPLTALANRRALPDALRAVQPHGAMLVFFDLDDFKRINDDHGHQAGDECLRRFAAALTGCFRPSDAVVRYAGDEFVVVASGLDDAGLTDRIDAVRARLEPSAGELPIRFSSGVGHLPPGGNPDEALRAADEAMYRAKPSRRRLRDTAVRA